MVANDELLVGGMLQSDNFLFRLLKSLFNGATLKDFIPDFSSEDYVTSLEGGDVYNNRALKGVAIKDLPKLTAKAWKDLFEGIFKGKGLEGFY